MRSVLTVLLAFAAGVLFTLWMPGRAMHTGLPSAAHHPVPAGASALISAAAATDSPPAYDTSGADRWPAQGPSPEQVLYAQPKMLQDALARLAPRVAGKPNLYLLAFAGDGAEDVFNNEVEYAAHLFATRFEGRQGFVQKPAISLLSYHF